MAQCSSLWMSPAEESARSITVIWHHLCPLVYIHCIPRIPFQYVLGWILPRRGTVTRFQRLKEVGAIALYMQLWVKAATIIAGVFLGFWGPPCKTLTLVLCATEILGASLQRLLVSSWGTPALSCWHLGSRVALPCHPLSPTVFLSFPLPAPPVLLQVSTSLY